MARVLIVSFSVAPAPDRRGVELVQLVRALATRHQVDCLTVKAGELGYVERFHRARMLRVPVGAPDAPRGERAQAFRRAVNRQLDGAEYDVVHARDIVGGDLAVERARELGYKVVFEPTGSEPTASASGAAAAVVFDAAALERCERGAHLLIARTRAHRNHLARKGLTERTSLVVPGCDIDLFDWESRVPGPPLVLALGSFAPTRAVRLLVRGFQAVRTAVPDARLLLVGPVAAGFESSLGSALAQLGLAGAVDRAGALDHAEVPRVIARSSVCVTPDVPQGDEAPLAPAPLSLLEFLACRRPVVAPRTSAIEDVIDDGESGLLFSPGDAGDLASKVITLLGDARRAATLAQAGYQKVRALYPASATRRGYLEAYARIVPPDRPRDHTPTPSPAFALESSTARRSASEITDDGVPRRDFDDQATSPSLLDHMAQAATFVAGQIDVRDDDDDEDDDGDAEATVMTPALTELPLPGEPVGQLGEITATSHAAPPGPEDHTGERPLLPGVSLEDSAMVAVSGLLGTATSGGIATPAPATPSPGPASAGDARATPTSTAAAIPAAPAPGATPPAARLSLAAAAEILRQAEFNEGPRDPGTGATPSDTPPPPPSASSK